jgi:hypothetical protein
VADDEKKKLTAEELAAAIARALLNARPMNRGRRVQKLGNKPGTKRHRAKKAPKATKP